MAWSGRHPVDASQSGLGSIDAAGHSSQPDTAAKSSGIHRGLGYGTASLRAREPSKSREVRRSRPTDRKPELDRNVRAVAHPLIPTNPHIEVVCRSFAMAGPAVSPVFESTTPRSMVPPPDGLAVWPCACNANANSVVVISKHCLTTGNVEHRCSSRMNSLCFVDKPRLSRLCVHEIQFYSLRNSRIVPHMHRSGVTASPESRSLFLRWFVLWHPFGSRDARGTSECLVELRTSDGRNSECGSDCDGDDSRVHTYFLPLAVKWPDSRKFTRKHLRTSESPFTVEMAIQIVEGQRFLEFFSEDSNVLEGLTGAPQPHDLEVRIDLWLQCVER